MGKQRRGLTGWFARRMGVPLGGSFRLLYTRTRGGREAFSSLRQGMMKLLKRTGGMVTIWRGLALALVWAGAFLMELSASAAACPALQFDGEVQAGKSYGHRLDAAHDFLLESLASGWIIRVLPAAGPRGVHDYAELATPPYRSPNPLLLSTDFAFRAQDAVAWNPREFRFFTTPAQLAAAARAYDASLREPNRPAAGAALFPLIAEACTAEFRILDARIVGGTADQSLMAAAVASHFAETAHTVDTSALPSKLGRMLSVRFRVTMHGAASPSRR